MNRTHRIAQPFSPTAARRIELALVATFAFTAGLITMAAHPLTMLRTTPRHAPAAASAGWQPGRAIDIVPAYVAVTLGQASASPVHGAASAYDGQALMTLSTPNLAAKSSFYDWRPGRAIDRVPSYVATTLGTASFSPIQDTGSAYDGLHAH